ncbi:MAG: hypothetical protein ACLT8C_06495 [Akkermansia muciniphila]
MPHLLSETLVWCVTLLLFGMGLIGTLIPMLPALSSFGRVRLAGGVMGRESGVGNGLSWRCWWRRHGH